MTFKPKLIVDICDKFENKSDAGSVAEPASAESPLNMSMNALNQSKYLKASNSLNLDDTLAFINALSYKERVEKVD